MVEHLPGEVQDLLEEQTDDPGIWAPAHTATEAYLQQALRRLHGLLQNENLDWLI